MVWNYFVYIGVVAVVLWFAGAWLAWRDKRRSAMALTMAGFALMAVYTVCLWAALDRPPMRTMGETRLWYSLLLPLAGIFVYSRWKYKWILSFTSILATVFVLINIFKPEIHSKNLMPALQSPWFAPHVIVYMLAYAMMGAAFVVALYLLFVKKKQGDGKEMLMIDNMVSISYAFLTLGMLMGALWAKTAWGHYWSWDPKETWAAITRLYPLSTRQDSTQPHSAVDGHCHLLPLADVLVGCQLSAVGPRNQCPHLQHAMNRIY